jgi:hypothetical protein
MGIRVIGIGGSESADRNRRIGIGGSESADRNVSVSRAKRLKSPLERHEVRLRGLPQQMRPRCTGAAFAQLKPRSRSASARDGARRGPSGGSCPLRTGIGICGAPAPANEFAARTARCRPAPTAPAARHRCAHRPRSSHPRPPPVHIASPVLGQSAQADFANFQRRMHSLRLETGVYRTRSAIGIPAQAGARHRSFVHQRPLRCLRRFGARPFRPGA